MKPYKLLLFVGTSARPPTILRRSPRLASLATFSSMSCPAPQRVHVHIARAFPFAYYLLFCGRVSKGAYSRSLHGLQ